jgi:hypothetical protein
MSAHTLTIRPLPPGSAAAVRFSYGSPGRPSAAAAALVAATRRQPATLTEALYLYADAVRREHLRPAAVTLAAA